MDFTYRCKKKKKAKSRLIRVWVERLEVSVQMSHSASFLHSVPRQWRVAKGPDEELVDVESRVSDPGIKSLTLLPLCRGGQEKRETDRQIDRLEEFFQLSWVTVRCSWEHRYDNGSDPVSL